MCIIMNIFFYISTDSRVPGEIITAESTSVDCVETSFQLDDGCVSGTSTN